MGVFLATAAVATVTVVAAAILVMVYGRPGTSADPLAMALAQSLKGKPTAVLVRERQQIILEDADAHKFTVTSAPKITSTPAAATTAGSTGSAAIVPSGPPPNPKSAQGIAYNMLPAFGFSTDQFGCLNNIWTRESGWRYNAENASGAYGIPQALPGSKMASAGADWQTDPTTQIKWGLGYIKSTYGTPCNAWAFWQTHSYY